MPTRPETNMQIPKPRQMYHKTQTKAIQAIQQRLPNIPTKKQIHHIQAKQPSILQIPFPILKKTINKKHLK